MVETIVLFRYGNAEPVSVLADPAGDPPNTRMFTVVCNDSPGPDSEPVTLVYHVDCLLDELGPSLAAGLDVAVRSRGARWGADGWEAAPELWNE